MSFAADREVFMEKLFDPKPDPRCIYCARSSCLTHTEVVCPVHGVVEAYDHCRRFRYDPLKRVPPKPVRLRREYSDEDFKL